MIQMSLKTIKNWFWHHKIRSIILLLILGGIGLYLVTANQPPKLETATVHRGEVATVVEASGTVQAKQTVDLNFPTPGKVVWVGVVKGDKVNAYQTLATQDQREVEKTIKNKLLDYMTARWDFEQLRDDKNVSNQAFNVLPILSDSERRILEKSQFGLDQSVLDVEVASLAREQAILYSPFEGTVVDDGGITAGQWLTTGNMASKAMRVINLNSLYFQANIDEADYAKIAVGQPVDIKLDSFPLHHITGRISYIGKVGVKKTGGSVQIPVDITIDAIPEGLVSELNGDVSITIEKKDNVLTLDKKFVHKTNDTYTVNMMQDNKLTTKSVTIGVAGPLVYEITGGLSEGDTVVNVVKAGQ